MRAWIVCVAVLGLSNFVFGQAGKYGATAEDSATCVAKLSVYKDFINEGNYREAALHWRVACKVCPGSQKTLYINGAKIYRSFIDEAKDEVAKQAYIDSLLALYDTRIEQFGERGKVLAYKAQDMYKFRSETATEEAVKLYKESITLEGNESGAGTVLGYYQAIYSLYGDKKIDKTPLLEEYSVVMDVCEFNIKQEGTEGNFQKAKDNIDKIFEAVAECSDVVGIYKTKIAASPNDLDLKRSAINILDKRKCEDAKEFGEWARAVCDVEPSVDCAVNIAKFEFGNKNYTSAAKYFETAINQCGSCPEKIEYQKYAAQTYYQQGQMGKVRELARAMLNTNSNSGDAYILLGMAAAAASPSCGSSSFENKTAYWVAVDYFSRAKSVDSSIAQEANSKIETYSKYFPTKADAFQMGFKDGDSYTVECLGETTTIRTQ